jgi:membrane protein implicated in regulation of membrane protease activity
MINLILNPETWLVLALIFLILEMTLDGSMIFFLPLGIGCGFTAAGLYGCNDSLASICAVYTEWHYIFLMTGIASIIAALLLRRAFKSKKDKHMNDY